VESSPPHRQFERQIERIHQLLEIEGSTVTWNDRIPDPDNPTQPRQIDVSIRRDDSLTLVECRLHKAPQDVTWIEELMGRRTSLKADAVIAVSASGFTKSAREKANVHGIHLRDLATLSRGEIQNWGRRRTFTLSFCEFTDVTLIVEANGAPSDRSKLTDAEGKPLSPLVWRALYQSIMQNLDKDKWTGAPGTIEVPVMVTSLINGRPPTSMTLHANVRRIRESVQLATVVEYADALSSISQAEVGRYDLGSSEIIENCGDEVAMTIDLRTIVIPDNCCFETVTIDAGRIVTGRLNVIGAEQAMRCRIPIQIQYVFSTRPSRA
jgi:hypothetical protein